MKNIFLKINKFCPYGQRFSAFALPQATLSLACGYEDSALRAIQDIWEFKDPQYPDYPTEKNADMLDLIIKTSSNEGSIVLDCFCGSGTTLKAAQINNRQWIGIDQSELAIEVTRKKIAEIGSDLFAQNSEYEYLDLNTIHSQEIEYLLTGTN